MWRCPGELLRVFFRWRAEVDAPLEEREAIPPLAYVAYAMCDGNRTVIPHRELPESAQHAGQGISGGTPGNAAEFLGLLEQRTGLLTQAGVETGAARSEALFRFRHMLFQQYSRRGPWLTANMPIAGKTSVLPTMCSSCCGNGPVNRTCRLVVRSPAVGVRPSRTGRSRGSSVVGGASTRRASGPRRAPPLDPTGRALSRGYTWCY